VPKLNNILLSSSASISDSTGSSILIFVPGMADIENVCELIERLNVSGLTFSCLAIHGDIPFDEQMAVFDEPKQGEVKVIVATNAAESSLTFPDVDHVICLG
jgi:HrpA-like RNA helicase